MGGALFEIIIMLVVAAGLGFGIAWFFQKNKLDKLQALHDQKVTDYNNLTQKHEDLTKSHTATKAELEDRKSEINKLNDTVKELNSDLDNSKKEAARLSGELDTSNSGLKEAQEQNKKTTSELTKAQADLQEMSDQNEKLQARLDSES